MEFHCDCERGASFSPRSISIITLDKNAQAKASKKKNNAKREMVMSMNLPFNAVDTRYEVYTAIIAFVLRIYFRIFCTQLYYIIKFICVVSFH